MELIHKYFPEIKEEQKERLAHLLELYQEWNQKINVISRQDMQNFYERHVLHSLAISKVIQFKKNDRIIDVGTGGTTITYRRDNCLSNDVGTIGGSAQALIQSGTNFVYTDDDVVSPSVDVSVGSTTLSAGTEYFICNSDFKSRFKLSFTSSTSTSS